MDGGGGGIKSFLFIGIKTVGYKWVSKKALLLALQTVPRNNVRAYAHARQPRSKVVGGSGKSATFATYSKKHA